MRLLIAQGPGFYGVNVRMITEATYERLLAKDEYSWTSEGDPAEGRGNEGAMLAMTENGTSLIMTESFDPGTETGGFDTGWWVEGQLAIEEVLK